MTRRTISEPSTILQNGLDHLSAALSHYYRVRFESVEALDVCIIDVDPVRDPVFMRGERGQKFYIRVGNTTRALDPEETLSPDFSQEVGASGL